jgi:acyl-CoA synthetase (AMP-forming)/AMP-acid ligase II
MTVSPAAAPNAAPARTLPRALRAWARSQPGAPAVGLGDDELDYRELDRTVDAAARILRGVGVTAGDRVVIAGHNSPEWVVAFLATLRLGAVAVPLNVRLGELEVRRQLELCDPCAILASEAFAPAFDQARPSRSTRLLLLERESDDRRSLWRRPAARAPARAPAPSQPALISFTSGATGAPKGAVISHRALVRSASAFVPRLETSSADRSLTLVPLFHNTGFVDQLSQLLLVGGSLDLLPEFRTAAAVDALAARPASYLIAVPSILRLLMLHERAEEAFRGCRVVVYGGSPMPPPWIRELAERWPGIRLFNCYGLTEFTSVSHLLDPEHALGRGGSVGRPVEGVRQQIAAASGQALPPGEVGEVCVAGPMRMTGYWRSAAATRKAFRGGWLRTGDLGTVDDGFLTVLGRSADVVNRGGEKIYVASVEAALGELAAVAEAAVVGAPHPIFQERVVAWVVPRRGGEFDEEEARRHLAVRIPDYAVPEAFVVVDELPRNGAGKLDRAQVRTEAVSLFGDGDR